MNIAHSDTKIGLNCFLSSLQIADEVLNLPRSLPVCTPCGPIYLRSVGVTIIDAERLQFIARIREQFQLKLICICNVFFVGAAPATSVEKMSGQRALIPESNCDLTCVTAELRSTKTLGKGYLVCIPEKYITVNHSKALHKYLFFNYLPLQ